jgi:hypothetical protein
VNFWAVIGVIIAIALALAALHDYRLRRQGRRFKLTAREAYQNRVDAAMRADPFFPGGPQVPQRKRDPKP